jgi:hypothetical protein
MRVIADFVLNHTSDKHPWFVESRKSVDNPFRDYYVWRKDTPPDTSEQVVSPGEETSIWTQDKATGEWYLHMFAKHQPDLNVANPLVRDEIAKSMGFWLQLGLDGLRLDAVPFLLELQGKSKEDAATVDPHDYLSALRSFLNRRNGSGLLLGEVNVTYKDQLKYFGAAEGNELNMQFDFLSMQNLYLSLAREDARPLAKSLGSRPRIHPDNKWAMFVRNHDELTLDSDAEREEVFAAFGPDEDMQMYGRGLRRRLPTVLNGDPARIRMVYSLIFALPGTPVLFYGEEIGMGEDLSAKGRSAVRTPMQWNDAGNGRGAERLPTPYRAETQRQHWRRTLEVPARAGTTLPSRRPRHVEGSQSPCNPYPRPGSAAPRRRDRGATEGRPELRRRRDPPRQRPGNRARDRRRMDHGPAVRHPESHQHGRMQPLAGRLRLLASRDGLDDQDLPAGGNLGGQALEPADLIPVDVYIHVASDCPGFIPQPPQQRRVLPGHRVQDPLHSHRRFCGRSQEGLPAGERLEHTGQHHADPGHGAQALTGTPGAAEAGTRAADTAEARTHNTSGRCEATSVKCSPSSALA